MAVNYLKKSRMYEIAKRLGYQVPVMKACEYRFYRGTEWLRFHDDSYLYEICASYGGKYLSVNTYYYDEGIYKRVLLSRKLINGYGKCNFYVCSL